MAARGGVRLAGAHPNKPMHPTANSVALIVSLAVAQLIARRVIGGVMSPLHVESIKSPAAPPLNALYLAWIIERLVECCES